MKLALIGYGKMGHIIEEVAPKRGHSIICTIDKDNMADLESEAFKQADVAIEFTTPTTAVANIEAAWAANIPIVCGTTGWTEMLPNLQNKLKNNGQALFWSSNYSLGVYILRIVNNYLSNLMLPMEQYKPSITETHHIHKLDAPSGTAKTLANDMLERLGREIPIESIREGEVAGIHTITYDSPVDTISITHSAKSREGFALGAVIAAEFLYGKKGFYGMDDMLKDLIKQ